MSTASSARSRARRYAVQALYEWQMTGNATKSIEQQFLIEHAQRQFDRQYFSELLFKVAEQVEELDQSLAPCLARPLDEVDPVEKAILRLATYELKHRVEIPYRVVINEAVELAKTFGAEQGHRFVNGILDKLAISLRSIEVAANKKGS